MVKFMYNGIKVDGKLYGATYSSAKLTNSPDGTITIYGKRYRDLPRVAGLTIGNDSDIMADHFANDTIRVLPSNPWYSEVLAACEAERAHNERTWAKRLQTVR